MGLTQIIVGPTQQVGIALSLVLVVAQTSQVEHGYMASILVAFLDVVAGSPVRIAYDTKFR